MRRTFTLRPILLAGLFGGLFIALAAFRQPSTFFGFQNPDVQVNLAPDRYRYPITQSKPEMALRVCNLEPGEEYEVVLVAAVRRVNCVPDFVPVDLESRQYEELLVRLTATSSCMDFQVQMACKGEFEPLDYMVSVYKTKDIKKPNSPFWGPDMPPAITTNANISIQNLVTNAIIGGDCFDVSNVTSAGNNSSNGAFLNGGTSIGFQRGVILSSGNIANATGPNNTPSAGTNFGIFTNDPDLAMIANGAIRDRTILEFDFVPTQDEISFRYVFASEEYCEFANSSFNDVFGFFLSGPGITGPFSNNAINLALLPNGQGVTINNVNHTSNQAFYVPNIPAGQPNCGGHPLAFPPATQDCQFDGFTVILTATATVIPCETYHIKLAVADVGDNIYDSAVFLEDNSFGGPDLVLAEVVGGIAGPTSLYEGCDEACFLFTRANNDLTEDLVVNFTLSPLSTATPGVDYPPLPSSIVIPAGLASICIPVTAFQDNIAEGPETIILLIENSCDCETIEVTMTIVDVPPMDVTLDDQEVCGSGPVTLSPGVNGGIPNYTYVWSTGQTTPSISVNPSSTTTYQVTVSDQCGNVEVEQATVTIITPPTAVLSGSGVQCVGGGPSTVEVSVAFTGNAPWVLVYSLNGVNQPPVTTSSNPYVFTINSNQTISLISVNPTSGNCPGTVSGSVTITQIQLNVSANATPILCNGDANGTVNANATGGIPTYSYTWNNGATGANVTGLPPGTYTVTAIDSEGCEGQTTVTIPDVTEVVVSVSNVVGVDCNTPNGSASASASGGTPGYTYSWSNGATGPSPSNFMPGTYTVTVVDSNGCEDEAQITINEDVTPPDAAANVNGILTCTNVTINLDGNGSSTGPNFTYQWTGPGIVSGANTLNPTVNAPGTYTILVTNTTNGCTEQATVSVSQNIDQPTAVGVAPPITCNDPTVQVSGVGSSTGPNFTYQWTGPSVQSGANTLTPTVGAPGTYTLVVTNADNGCTATTNVNVGDQTQLPNAVATAPPITCANTQVSINSAGTSTGPNFSYNWTTSGGNIVSGANTLNPVVNQPGSYTMVVTNNITGCEQQVTVNVGLDNTPPNAVANAPNELNCNNTTVQINGNGSSTGAGINYNWTTTNGNITSGANTINPTVSQPGTYLLTVTNANNGCTNTAQVTVTQDITPPQVAVAAPVPITCFNPTQVLDGTNSSQGPNFNYLWTGPSIVAGQNTLNPTIAAPGAYTLIVTNANNGCTANTSVIVPANNTPPLASAGPPQEITCTQTEVQLNGAGSSFGPNFDFLWSTQNGNFVSPTNIVTPVVNQPGLYTITVVNLDNGCESSSNVIVTIDDNVPMAVVNQPAGLNCIVTQVGLNGSASSTGPNFSFNWSTVGGNFLGSTNTLTPTVNAPGQYTLTVSNSANGCVATATVNVQQDIQVPQALVVPPGIISCTNQEIVLDGSFSTNTGPLNYVWTTFGGNFVSGQFTLTPTINQGGTYVLNISNFQNGCSASTTVFVQDLTDLPLTVIQPAPTLTCAATEVNLNATQSESGPGYIIAWTTPNGNIVAGGNTLTPTVNEPGIYQLAITNTVNSCVGNATIIVPQSVNLPTASIASPAELNCTVQNVQLNGSIGGGSNLNFTWSTPNGNIVAGGTTLNPTVNEPGTYVLDVVNQDNACVNSTTIEVEQDVAIPLAVAGDPATLTCYEPQLSLDGTGSSTGPIMNYQWTTPNGNILSGANTLNPSINQPGTYTLTVVNQSNTCLESATVVVDIDQVAPLADAGPLQTINCYNPTLQLLGTNSSNGPQYQYAWSTANGNLISGVNTLTPTIDAPGTYQLEVFNVNNGCESLDVVSIDINIDVPVADAGPGGLLTCVENTYTLQADAQGNVGDFVYNWTTPSGNIISGVNTLSPIVNAQGNYTLSVLDTLNGCSVTATVFVDQDANVPIALTEPVGALNCVSSQMEINGSNSSQSPNILFEWTTANGNIVAGDNTLNPVIDLPGTYVLTLTDTTNSCVAVSSIIITPDTLAPVMAILPPNILTCAVTEIDLTANVSANSPNLGINWTTPNGNFVSGTDGFNPIVSAPGQYNLTVVNNNNGCENSTSAVVQQDIVIPSSAIDDPAILTCVVTEISLLATASTANTAIEYNWSTANGNILDGFNTPTPMVNEPGTYELLVTDPVNGCQTLSQIDVPQDIVFPIADPGATNVLTCAVQTLSLNGMGSSQGAVFEYTWTTPDGNILQGETTLQPLIDEPGEYVLEVLNTFNGCLSSNLVSITQDTVHPIADAGPTAELTCLITDLSLQGSGSQGNDIVYQWTTNDGQIVSGANTLNPVIDEPGTYELLITNETNGCETLTNVTITQDVEFPATSLANPDILTCAVTSIQLDATGTDAGPLFNLNWSTANGNILSGGNTLQPQVNEPGEYLLTVVNTYNNCISTISTIVPQDIVAPDVSAGSTQTLTCAFPVLNLSGAGTSTGANFEYLWTTLNGNIQGGETSLQPAIDAPGTYNLLVTNTVNGCISEDQVLIDEDFVDPTVLIANPDLLTCSLIAFQLDATASSSGAIFQYQWTTPDGNILSGAQSPSPTVNQPGTYVLNIVNTDNGCTNSLDVLVNQDIAAPQVDAGAGSTLTCAITSLNLNGTAQGQSGSVSVAWSTSNGNILNGGTTLTPTINQPGIYTLLVTDQFNGCTSTDQVQIDIDVVAPTLLIAQPAILTCAVETLTLNAQGSSAGAIFDISWSTNNGNILQGANTLSPEINQPGTYQLTILNSNNGCISSGPVTVAQDIVHPVVDAGQGYTLPCDEELSYLSGNISQAGPNPQVLWVSVNGSIVAGANTLTPAINSGGTYEIIVLNTVNGCESSDLVEIIENVPENLDAIPRYPPCFGDSGSIQVGEVVGGTPPYVYSIDNGQTFQTNTLFNPLPAGNYTVLVQDALGCETSVNIPLPEPPEVIVDLEATVEIQLGDSYQLQALVNFPEASLSYIQWTPSESLSCSNCLSPIATPTSTTSYLVQVLNEEGCPAEARVLLFVDQRPAIYVPNVFSPNGDGNNDIFMIFAKENSIREIKQFLVFSRWGETVFQYNNFLPNNPAYGWDGRHRGQLLNPAVFVWWAEVEMIDGRIEILKGDVTLVR